MPAALHRCHAIEAHTPEPADVFDVKAGDVLAFERRETEWEGWIWCTDPRGRHAWVPENWVTIEGSRCRMTRDYNSRELAVRRGEILDVTEIESGWAWATNSRLHRGWVPLRCLEILN